MGIKKMFRMKPEPEVTPEQNREELMTQGIEVKSDRQRKQKFGAFKDYARDKNDNREDLKPRILDPNRPMTNPYASYDSSRDTHLGNRYGQDDVQSHRSQQAPPPPQQQQQSPYTYNAAYHPDEESIYRLPTGQSNGQQMYLDNATIHTNLNETYQNRHALMQEEEEDLNEIPEDHLLELELTSAELEQLRLQQEEDEEINSIKLDIKFTKQQSVASTRNTLRMAEELYLSGQNTLGMLGSQSERLYGIQRNLLLLDVQNKMAEDKTKEMQKLNRSIFAVHASNPFNSKRRLRMQEEKIKQARLNEKILLDQQRLELHSSERRVIDGLRDPNSAHTHTTGGELYNKYNDKKILENAKRYQFENDSEDDDMEREIHHNLTLIHQHAGNLKKMAVTISKETDSQNKRMNDIEEDADKLDISVHMNNHRLNGMR